MSTRVVTFHYTVKDKSGKKVDSSVGSDPMSFLEGSGQIIPGLESALKDVKAGDKKSVDVKAAEAYGEYDKELKFDVPKTQFPKGEQIEVGMQFRAGQPGEPSPVFTVTSVSDASISVDGNHPLAGQDLSFEVEVVDVRDATLEEIKHGHAHGPGDHHH